MKVLCSILYILSLLSVSCSAPNETKEINTNNTNPEYVELFELIEQTEDELASGIIFAQSAQREMVSFKETISRLKTNLLKLMSNSKNTQALNDLYRYSEILKAFPLQSRDIEFIKPIIKKLNFILIRTSMNQNRRLQNLNWKIYSNSFDNGLGKYTTFGSNDKWRIGDRNRNGYLSVSSQDSKSWLITPLINFQDIKSPALKIKHLIKVKETSTLTIKEIQNSIKVLISTDYQNGEPENSNWELLDLNNYNIITDFNAQESNKIELSTYENQLVSIAFVLDINLKERITWQIDDLSLYGAPIIEDYDQSNLIKERIDPTNYTYKKLFSDGFNDFKEIQSGENPAVFENIERNDEKYVQINGFKNKSNGVNFLISPVIELKDLDYSIKMKQAINFYEQEAKDKNYISIKIGLGDDIENIEWKDIEFKNIPPGNEWTPITTEWKKLNVKNQKIRIAFRYESGNGISQYPNWSLYELLIKEE